MSKTQYKSDSADDSSDNSIDDKKLLKFIIGIASIPIIIILCVTLVIPILQLAFGANYINQCPMNPYIPIYLIVSGACGIATILLILIVFILIVCVIKKQSATMSVVAIVIITLISLFFLLMSTFLFAWFIAGNVWIFSARSTVQHDNPLASNYCQKTLYEFSFWILIVTYIFMFMNCCCTCCKSAIQGAKAAKNMSA